MTAGLGGPGPIDGEATMSSLRRTAILVVFCMVATACGSRLSEEQRLVALQGAGGQAQPGVAAGGSDAAGFDDGGVPGGATAADGGDVTAGSGPLDSGGTPGAGAGGADPGAPTGNSPSSPQGPTTPQTNPGATDTGVSGEKIVLSNISDISGAIPGFYVGPQSAGRAYVEMFNATQQPLFGRKLEYLPLDSKLTAAGSREAMIEACERSFAQIGGVAVFDQTAGPVAQQCGIPDMPARAVTPARKSAATTFGMHSEQLSDFQVGPAKYFVETEPQSVKTAAYLHGAGDAAEQYKRAQIQAYESVGFSFVYEQAIDIQEANYAPYVLEMKRRDVKFVTFLGAYQQAVRLAQAMKQQSFVPDVYLLGATAYDTAMLELGGQAMEGARIVSHVAMIEEAASNPEMQRYIQWLKRTAPDVKPSYFGMFAWSSGMLFTEAARKAGPNLTRQGMIQALRGFTNWDGNGIHAPQNVGGRKTTDCFMVIAVKDGRFVRETPSRGFRCGDGLFHTTVAGA